ncbi:hypothetical protein EI42_06376 [Thermosporothrix hazakensis]|jgi:hypothetical protein|uniref:Acyltransferase n=2 Tax=Thermosporothrix TaxID=768650 RepID=A0A326U3H9_THEHA|nr:acyltransferase domain-containing protein [Thermosporothrix hazakensis]PZW18062.1 hypothetical protein EI42_06376 [Thermosporothrix hazakensis]BBH85328.1 hypothetical protein KTC_00790 [Thermosporothrix sp. COM3]GCE46241.1 hypothetical protein KTH_11100 [Thermosporothrix hazakensis]
MSLQQLTATEVSKRLGLHDDFFPWLKELEALEQTGSTFALPAIGERDELLARLHIEPEDAAEIISAWPQPTLPPEWWWLLQRCHQQLVAQIDTPTLSLPSWQPLPSHLGAMGRLFYVYVFLATLPTIRQWHRERGIPDEISWATLADLGENIAIYRRMVGETSLNTPQWPMRHFSGTLYRLGRLQFERTYFLGETNPTVSNVDLQPSALSVHIPESGGSLEPSACDQSFEQARRFFARHFPEETYHIAQCSSWLLDPQLADYLPPTSHIIRFQQRFHLLPDGITDDQNIMRYVFRRIAPALDELPQRTTLQQAIVRHIRAGKHWQIRTGWLKL